MKKLRELYSLKGLRIVVTGGSSGLGLSQAIMMAELGATVFSLSRTGKVKEIDCVDLPDNIHFLKVDVVRQDEIKSAFGKIGKEGGIDVLVNNAGITLKKKAEDLNEQEWEHIHQVNVNGMFRCSKAAFPWLRKSAHVGRIINISSMASYFGFSEVVPYASSKAAVLGITRGLAVEWSQENILVNSVSPGWFPSELSKQVMDREREKKILARMPLHRFGDPEELAAMVCFLVSPAATYITGQDFSVDGGARAFGF